MGGLVAAIMQMLGSGAGGAAAGGASSGAGGMMGGMMGGGSGGADMMEVLGQSGIGKQAVSNGMANSGKRRTSAEGLASLDSSSGAGAGLTPYKDVSSLGAKPYDMNSLMSELNQLANSNKQPEMQPMDLSHPNIQALLGQLLGG